MLLPPTSSPLTKSRPAPHADRIQGTILNARKGDAACVLGGCLVPRPGGSPSPHRDWVWLEDMLARPKQPTNRATTLFVLWLTLGWPTGFRMK